MRLSNRYIGKIITEEVFKLVEANGGGQQKLVPTIPMMKHRFLKWDNAVFGIGTAPTFEVTQDPKILGYFSCTQPNVGNPKIQMSAYYQYTDTEFDSIFCHEMIHYRLAINGVPNNENFQHGQAFQNAAAQINNQYGLNISATVDISNMSQNNQSQQQIAIAVLQRINANYFPRLQQILSQLKPLCNNKTAEGQYNGWCYYFTNDLIKAIQRCTAAKSLDENDMMMGVDQLPVIKNFLSPWNEYGSMQKLADYLDHNRMMNKHGSSYTIGDSTITLSDLVFNEYPKLKSHYRQADQNSNGNLSKNDKVIQRSLFPTVDGIENELKNASQVQRQTP